MLLLLIFCSFSWASDLESSESSEVKVQEAVVREDEPEVKATPAFLENYKDKACVDRCYDRYDNQGIPAQAHPGYRSCIKQCPPSPGGV
ncbi:MAG: hypothetical protein K2Q26_10610 [Bdellovibrionales bacterium]|nr:hypothetical protein [Bdellovibrionales bacterium]